MSVVQMLAEMTEEVKLELGTEFDIYNNESIYILGEKARVNLLIPKLSSLKEKGKASRKCGAHLAAPQCLDM